MEGESIKVPGFVVSSIICLLVSIGATVGVMLFLGYKRGETVYEQQKEAKAMQGQPGGASPAGMRPQQFGPQDEGKARMSQGLGDPRPAQQAVMLVTKLDELTVEEGKLQLTAEQAAKV